MTFTARLGFVALFGAAVLFPLATASAQEEEEGRRGRRGGRGMMGLPIDEMREQLELTDEQVSQFEAMNEQMRARGEEMREMFRSGNMEGAREMMQGFRTEMETSVREILTEEQFTKYEELQSEMRGGRGRYGGGEGRGGGRERQRARLREQAVTALALSPEEEAFVLERLDTVLETRTLIRQEQEQRRQDFLSKVRSTTEPTELQTALGEFRAAQAADRESEQAAMNQLREVLTLEQEAQLVALGILE
jgi:periplasmic protein CpxP/Spy